MMPSPNIPSWRRWLSYLFEIPLEQVSSEWNPYLQVSLSKGRLQLSTNNAIYSYADKYANFRQVFEQLAWHNVPENQPALILGFGLGSIPYLLEHTFGKSFDYTGVEIDEAVIYLASKWVLPDLKSSIQLVQADAFTFVVQSPPQKYPIIFMDVFHDAQVPAPFETDEFIGCAKLALSENGLLVFNRLARTQDDVVKALHYFETVFEPAFPRATFLDTKGNLMLISDGRYLKS